MKQPIDTLNEDTLNAGIDVIFKGNVYQTGNRRHTIVELWKDDKYITSVDMKDIQIVNPHTIINSLKEDIRRINEVEIKPTKKALAKWEKYIIKDQSFIIKNNV